MKKTVDFKLVDGKTGRIKKNLLPKDPMVILANAIMDEIVEFFSVFGEEKDFSYLTGEKVEFIKLFLENVKVVFVHFDCCFGGCTNAYEQHFTLNLNANGIIILNEGNFRMHEGLNDVLAGFTPQTQILFKPNDHKPRTIALLMLQEIFYSLALAYSRHQIYDDKSEEISNFFEKISKEVNELMFKD